MKTCSIFNTELCPLCVGVQKSKMNTYLLFQILVIGRLVDIYVRTTLSTQSEASH